MTMAELHPSGHVSMTVEAPPTYLNRAIRGKRTRYAPKACEECKRRKVKCDGKSPCHQCTRSYFRCNYAERTRSGRPSSDLNLLKRRLEMLQEQVSALASQRQNEEARGVKENPQRHAFIADCDSRCPSHMSNPTPSQADSQRTMWSTASNYPPCSGHPSSSSFRATAATSISRIGVHSTSNQPDTVSVRCPAFGPADVPRSPLLRISEDETLRLIGVYEAECGLLYPFLDLTAVRQLAHSLLSPAHGGISSTPRSERTSRENVTLEMIVAIALVIEGRGQTTSSTSMLDDVEAEMDFRPCGASIDVRFLETLTLMSIYQFYRDEEMLAWRTIGLAARAALEMGLHLREPPFECGKERDRTNRLFWCIYALDRRWSLGTGLPFALHEEDIDPSLPEPRDSPPHLFTSMIACSRIGSKIWKASLNLDHFLQPAKREDTAFLEYQVRQWHDSLSPELRFNPDDDLVIESLSPAMNRHRILFHLRMNHMRMLIHRRSLLTPNTITADTTREGAQLAVDLARESILLLDKLHRVSALYSAHQTCFNYFLYSALTLIFLAVCHAKARFYEYCRREFLLALDLIGGVSARSHLARKLWKTIKHLKVVGPKLGILAYMDTADGEGGGPGGNGQTYVSPRDEHQVFAGHGQQVYGHAAPSVRIDFGTQTRQADGLQVPMSNGCPSLFMHECAVDGGQLSSELSGLFQAIEPRYDPMPLQLMGQYQRTAEPARAGTAEDLSRSLWNYF
ncbi:uncharacterized protein A1O5_01915 [Cladophialophora psammophila CBS 110553]|uniref:Zn(2)-C6 fungal-type domain-containing protein n=1 Tax=Cladophialophora psammophila CBS 110553 TaxID=1182543 RepID=W9XY54_9EURO|nr:uncharacterized protein A1O5_01915 [Cladophialophora psammophila CBS 110553]EXJ75219.1 hypothetical protein A1O5_01915 [Cladophialophora psammophila CBS 110553]